MEKILIQRIDFIRNIRIIRPFFLSQRSSVAEQRICNPLVVSSTLTAGSILIPPASSNELAGVSFL